MKFFLTVAAMILISSTAYAGTVTLKTPPADVRFNVYYLVDGLSHNVVINPGDTDLIITGSSSITITVSPVEISSNKIIGMFSGIHSVSRYTKNAFNCNSDSPYIGTMELVGTDLKSTCNTGRLEQIGDDPARDIVLQLNKS